LGWDSKWETTSKIVFPIAFPNIITGIISIGRVSGDDHFITLVPIFYLRLLLFSIGDGIALSFIMISTSGTDIENQGDNLWYACISHYQC
jgi:phosphate transport system permease protein